MTTGTLVFCSMAGIIFIALLGAWLLSLPSVLKGSGSVTGSKYDDTTHTEL